MLVFNSKLLIAATCVAALLVVGNAVGPNEALCGPTDADSCIDVKGPYSMEMYPKMSPDNIYTKIKLKMVRAYLWEKNTTAEAFTGDFDYKTFKEGQYSLLDTVEFVEQTKFDSNGDGCDGDAFEKQTVDGVEQFICKNTAVSDNGFNLHYNKIFSLYKEEADVTWNEETILVPAGGVKENYAFILSDELQGQASEDIVVDIVWAVDFQLPTNLDEVLAAGVKVSFLEELASDEELVAEVSGGAVKMSSVDGEFFGQNTTSLTELNIDIFFSLGLTIAQSVGYSQNDDLNAALEAPADFVNLYTGFHQGPGAPTYDNDELEEMGLMNNGEFMRYGTFDIASMKSVIGEQGANLPDSIPLPLGAVFVSGFEVQAGSNQYYIDPVITLGQGIALSGDGFTLGELILMAQIGGVLVVLCCCICCLACIKCCCCGGKKEDKNVSPN